MLLSLLIIVALIWAAVVGTIYSNFLVFYSNFSESDNYNKAYYASIAALERAELVTKQRQPWFEWTGGRMNDGKASDSYGNYESDAPIENNFSYLTQNNAKISTSKRHIDSLTNRIPTTWGWNVDRMLSTGDSEDYNMMDYNLSEIFLLYKDPSDSYNPYEKLKKQNMVKSELSKITGVIRLPGKLKETFWNLDTNNRLIWSNEKDDAIVDRQVMWRYSDSQFTIFSTQDISNWTPTNQDTAIRESDLNDGYNFEYSTKKDPNKNWSFANNRTIIIPTESNIKNFNEIFSNDDDEFSLVQLRFSLLNQLRNRTWDIYPFLEYYTSFDGDVPDKYFTINSEWGYGDYVVNLTIIKPTIKESILKSFTTIF